MSNVAGRWSRSSGLYDPVFEHDACGVGFVATLNGVATHAVVENALTVLARMRHRGAAGADPLTGDGSGILLQIPHDFFARHLAYEGIDLPLAGDYGVAQVFLSRDAARRQIQTRVLEETVRYHGQKVIAWRDVPIDEGAVGPMGQASMPVLRQLFIGRMAPLATFERTLFTIRKRAGKRADTEGAGDLYIASCSARTIVYKGLPLPEKLPAFYLDLQDRELKSRLAVVHSRFSTNTNPSWERAHPYRRIAHNGEINTLSGNVRWMSAREPRLATHVFREHLQDFKPIVRPGGSDSGSLDNVVDFLTAAGRPIAEVMMMLVPEAWESRTDLDDDVRAFYAYHASLTEPWDGPAALVFTDGKRIGACLDRNGLRPLKYVVTDDGLVVLASELGVLPLDPETLVQKGRVRPGELFLVDTDERRIVSDSELKRDASSRKPYREWLAREVTYARDLFHDPLPVEALPKLPLEQALRLFGTTRDDLRIVFAPMAATGEEPVGSMGNDAPLAVLSDKAVSFFRYFKQQFAQVTNPPIDPIRERLVMSLTTRIGAAPNLLSDELSESAPILELEHPILSSDELRALLSYAETRKIATTIPSLFDATDRNPEEALLSALDELTEAALAAVSQGKWILVLSDREASSTRAPIPPLLATACVHHALNRAGLRLPGAIVVDTGGAREVADMALLFGYGATLLCPYLAESAVRMLAKRGDLPGAAIEPSVAAKNYRKAIEKGLLKVLSKMGISTLESYRGAQLFEAVGLERAVCERFLTGTVSRLEGVGLREIAEEVLYHHRAAFSDAPELDTGGVYAYRTRGERHLWTPDSVAALQKAVRTDDASSYARYAELINDQRAFAVTLRGLCGFVPAGPAVPLGEVEPASEIVKRFCTGAMSFGSISKEAHENLAIAMNRIGGKSNTGEGGEDEARAVPLPNGDRKRSAIKQVASGRFGVTASYLVSADEIQIKVAQGAKPGEGGQLPGHKVDAIIARVRHSTPGVTLISPPPHHDIYSIEDLAQLIFDLKSVAPNAKVSVKLVSEAGIGTVAAGVAKAGADGVTVAGHDGGTGASPLSSIQHAGTPWELGLAEVQQVLRKNGLRGRLRLQVDGQLKTGRDVAFAAMFGADEFGFATAPLVASGCIMMRKCHLNTCPVGIATQDETLRARFHGEPEHVIRYFFYVAEELRSIMAGLGFRTVAEMVGRIDCVAPENSAVCTETTLPNMTFAPGQPGWGRRKASLLSLANLLSASDDDGPRAHEQNLPPLSCGEAEASVITAAASAIDDRTPFHGEVTIENRDRAFGARLSGLIAQKHGSAGLPDDTIVVRATGTAGQSFGAFASRGMTLSVFGDANDYVGKGLSGGILVVRPSIATVNLPEASVIVGNTVLYGATSGRVFFRGRAGERFAVRNSGATAVVEGVGDHGCEYMTGGVVLILGSVGRNFAAGMSGGVAYVLTPDGQSEQALSGLAADLVCLPLDDADEAVVLGLLREHLARTDSPLAAQLLTRGEALRSDFRAIVSSDYQKLRVRARTQLPLVSGDKAHG